MSQSSNSSWKSLETRKRARTSSPESPRKSQRKRSSLTLKRRYIEISSQSSSESFSKFDTQSTVSFSITTGASSEINSSNLEYASLAKQYGINIACAKKFHSILTSTAQVSVIRTASIKHEPMSPEITFRKSPVFRSKKRGRKPKCKIESSLEEKIDSPQGKALSKRASRNIFDYFQTLNDTTIKQEPKSDNSLEEFADKKLSLTCNQLLKNQHFNQSSTQTRYESKSFPEVTKYRHQQSLSQPLSSNQRFSRSQNYLSESQDFIQNDRQPSLKTKRCLSQENYQNLSRSKSRKLSLNKWKELIDSSGDEFVELRSKKNSSIKSATNSAVKKNRTIVTNPFSKVQKKSKNLQKSKIKKESFWKKKFGNDDDPATRKKKFIETFILNNEDNLNEDRDDCISKVNVENEFLEKEEKTNNLPKNRINKNKSNVDEIEFNIQSSVDSLSVNCQYFNPKTVKTSMISKSCSSSLPLSFGADPSDCDQQTLIKDNLCDSNVDPSQNNVNIDIVNNVDLNNDKCSEEEEEENNLNDSFLSLDLTESPIKSEDESIVKSLNKKKSSIQKPNIVKTLKKSHAKPKIISDSKLPNNAIILSDPKTVAKKKLQLKVNPAIISTDSNQLLSLKSPLEESNEVNQNIKGALSIASSPFVPILNGVKKTFVPDHGKIQLQINNLVNNNGIEESFDSLCQDVTDLTNNDEQIEESITLYKVNNESDINVEVISTSAVDSSHVESKEKSGLSLNLESTEIKTKENTCPDDTKEKPLLYSNILTGKSPITFQRRSRLSLSLRSPKLIKAKEKTISPDTDEKALSSPSSSIYRKSPIDFQLNPQPSISLKSTTESQENLISTRPDNRLQQQNLSQFVTNKMQQQQITSEFTSSFQTSPILANKDSQLNRSISPVKSTNLSSRDPRLNRSTSPLESPVVSRPNSPTKCADSTDKSPDPRLQERKEKEDTEETFRMKQGIHSDKYENNSQNITRDTQTASNQSQKKASVFERLGRKSPSPNKSAEITKELLDIVKNQAGKRRSIGYYDSDDEECISIHPGHIFSSDEESDASPPHRKFTPERRFRVFEDIRNKNISVNDRLTWNSANINQRKPSSFTMSTMSNGTAMTTTRAKAINKITYNTNASNQFQSVPTTFTPHPLTQQISKMSDMTAYASQCRNIPFNTYNNNDPAFNEQFYKNSSTSINDKYYKMNAAQMLKDVDDLRQFGCTPNVTFDNNNGCQMNTDFRPSVETPRTLFFRSYCFRVLQSGNCSMEMSSCHFSHNVQSLQKLIALKKLELLKPILEFAIRQKFKFFLKNVWSSILPILNHEAFDVYNKLYQADMRLEEFLNELLDYCINTKIHTVESFVKKLAPYIEQGNRDWVRAICKAIKPKMADGFCWETIKCLSQKAVPPVDMIELTILQCLKRKKNKSHINEVYDLVIKKMSNLERDRMSQTMLKQFFNLVQTVCLLNNKEVLNTLPIANATNNITENSISSPISRCQSEESTRSAETEKPSNKTTSPLSPLKSCDMQQPNNSPVEVQIRTPNKGESTNFSEYIVKEIESSEPTSVFRKRFWKLYLAVTTVDEGLDHEDYDYVWKTLNDFSNQNFEDRLLKRAYYHILCKNIKSCERHITEIIKRAVHNRWPTSQKCLDLLFEVGICALIDLTDSELWVMALNLLNSMKIIEPNEPRTAFVLICAEIYLANNDSLEALYLLQRTRLIKTNRDEWLTKDHTKSDEKHRNKVVTVLLEALSYADPEKAVYIFKALLVDQYIYYYPIDLRLYLDKLVLLLLLHEEEDLIADVCREIISHDLTLQRATYRELITRMLPVNELLTNQILDYAIHLGYYNDIQIKNGFTTIIVDTNSSEEELYLILRRLIHILTLNIGSVIHHLKPNQLKVILIFEDIPVEKRLYRNETAITYKDTYKSIRNKVNKMLATRFTPPIRISRGKVSKFCKIMSRTLVDYLKHWN